MFTTTAGPSPGGPLLDVRSSGAMPLRRAFARLGGALAAASVEPPSSRVFFRGTSRWPSCHTAAPVEAGPAGGGLVAGGWRRLGVGRAAGFSASTHLGFAAAGSSSSAVGAPTATGVATRQAFFMGGSGGRACVGGPRGAGVVRARDPARAWGFGSTRGYAKMDVARIRAQGLKVRALRSSPPSASLVTRSAGEGAWDSEKKESTKMDAGGKGNGSEF